MEFIRSVLVNDVTPAADGDFSYDLPSNPLSHIMLTIKGLNVTNEATLAEILQMISNVTVSHLGQSIVNMSAEDLYAYNCLLFGRAPVFTNLVATDDATRAVSLVIPFGRRIFDPAECFPAVQRGDFQLKVTVDIANAGIDGLILQAETVELLGANPARYLKATTLSSTPAATGAHDVPLPIGHPYIGILLFGTTYPTGTVWTATINEAQLLADNIQKGYTQANWESMHGDLIHRCGHVLGGTDAWTDDVIPAYALMDFDPNRDDNFLIETAQMSTFLLRVDAGDTNVLRAIPLELVKT